MESNFTEAEVKELHQIVQYYEFDMLCEIITGLFGLVLAFIFT